MLLSVRPLCAVLFRCFRFLFPSPSSVLRSCIVSQSLLRCPHAEADLLGLDCPLSVLSWSHRALSVPTAAAATRSAVSSALSPHPGCSSGGGPASARPWAVGLHTCVLSGRRASSCTQFVLWDPFPEAGWLVSHLLHLQGRSLMVSRWFLPVGPVNTRRWGLLSHRWRIIGVVSAEAAGS